QFYLIGCHMSSNILDTNICYAYSDKVLDPCPWGLRTYYFGCTREGGHGAWMNNNLDDAKKGLQHFDITASWTFANRWDPEKRIRDLWKYVAY
ncbi:MAG: pectate lyase, partial [Prevotellaceae bacterium]|nr:pectate lyase [Prevotellaceae bacterium]